MNEARTLKLGLIGHPVKHSLSPKMHKAALVHFGLEGDYELFDVPPDELGRQIVELRKKGYTGLNVTVPHKQSVVPFVDRLTVEAKRVGAVNSVRFEPNGQSIGHNTDLGGFLRALSNLMAAPEPGSRACVIGSGGAARAGLWAMALFGFPEIVVVARNAEAAAQMVHDFEAEPASAASPVITTLTPDQAVNKYDLVVNATPIGLTEPDLPSWMVSMIEELPSTSCFIDMVYSPDGKTPLVSLCRSRQLRAFDGTSMLAHQAALAFGFWTGQLPPVDILMRSLEN